MNRLNKTKEERFPDLRGEREERDRQLREAEKRSLQETRRKDKEEQDRKEKEREQRYAKIYKSAGDFLPISRGQISAPFSMENSHLFPQYHV